MTWWSATGIQGGCLDVVVVVELPIEGVDHRGEAAECRRQLLERSGRGWEVLSQEGVQLRFVHGELLANCAEHLGLHLVAHCADDLQRLLGAGYEFRRVDRLQVLVHLVGIGRLGKERKRQGRCNDEDSEDDGQDRSQAGLDHHDYADGDHGEANRQDDPRHRCRREIVGGNGVGGLKPSLLRLKQADNLGELGHDLGECLRPCRNGRELFAQQRLELLWAQFERLCELRNDGRSEFVGDGAECGHICLCCRQCFVLHDGAEPIRELLKCRSNGEESRREDDGPNDEANDNDQDSCNSRLHEAFLLDAV